MDVERLKNGETILTNDYFERQLKKIREIRLSEGLLQLSYFVEFLITSLLRTATYSLSKSFLIAKVSCRKGELNVFSKKARACEINSIYRLYFRGSIKI